MFDGISYILGNCRVYFPRGNIQSHPLLQDRARPNPKLTLALLPGMQRWHNLLLPHKPTHLVSGPREANLVLIAYASSEGSGEPAHPRSLARTFAARSYKQ